MARLRASCRLHATYFVQETYVSRWRIILQWAREAFKATELAVSMSEACEAHLTEEASSTCMLIAIVYVHTTIQSLPKDTSECHMVFQVPSETSHLRSQFFAFLWRLFPFLVVPNRRFLACFGFLFQTRTSTLWVSVVLVVLVVVVTNVLVSRLVSEDIVCFLKLSALRLCLSEDLVFQKNILYKSRAVPSSSSTGSRNDMGMGRGLESPL